MSIDECFKTEPFCWFKSTDCAVRDSFSVRTFCENLACWLWRFYIGLLDKKHVEQKMQRMWLQCRKNLNETKCQLLLELFHPGFWFVPSNVAKVCRVWNCAAWIEESSTAAWEDSKTEQQLWNNLILSSYFIGELTALISTASSNCLTTNIYFWRTTAHWLHNDLRKTFSY